MPALKQTDFHATVRWVGVVADASAGIASNAEPQLDLGFDGPKGDCHGGLTRPSCSRVTSMHRRGTQIANVRQISILSVDDLSCIAAEMGLETLDPAWLGATLVIDGIPDFTLVPPSSRLQGSDGVTLVVDMGNRPCHLPTKVIEAHHPGKGKAFKTAARNRRGVTAWVERPGRIAPGDLLRLHIPDQPVWPHLDRVRT